MLEHICAQLLVCAILFMPYAEARYDGDRPILYYTAALHPLPLLKDQLCCVWH